MFEAVVFSVRIPSCTDGVPLYWCGALYKASRLYSFILPLRSKKNVQQALARAASGDDIRYRPFAHKAFQAKVRAYFSGKQISFTEKIEHGGGSVFSGRVLDVVRGIPYGHTMSYAMVARRAGVPNAARAVGTVMAQNKLPLIIPCHRVIKSNGERGRFSAGFGEQLKKIMLDIEKNKRTCY